MKYVGLICYLLILRPHSISCSENAISDVDLTVNLHILQFDVSSMSIYPDQLVQNFVNLMINDTIMYLKHSSLGTSININSSMNEKQVFLNNAKMSSEYLLSYCRALPKNFKPSLSILFTDTPNKNEQSQVLTEKGGYCDTTKDCAIIEFRSWTENAINLARAIASSVGIDFDNSPSSPCNEQNTIMNMKYKENAVGLPYTWSECSKNDLKMFLKTDKSSCLHQLKEPVSLNNDKQKNKLKIQLQFHFDLPYNELYLNWDDFRDKLKLETEAYFNHNKLNLPIDLDIRYAELINATSNNAQNAPIYLNHYCNEIKRSDNSKYLSIVITNKDLYVLNAKGKKNYDHVFYIEKGNYCNQSSNCAVIEHGLWSDDVFNVVRVIARSLGISFDGSENSNCDEDDTIMSTSYDGQNLPKQWSQCSRNDFDMFMRSGKSSCLDPLTKPEIENFNNPNNVPRDLKDIEIGLELHFLKKNLNQRTTSEDLKSTAISIIEIVQQLLLRPKLNLLIKPKLINAVLLPKEPSMTVHTMNKYCKQETNKMGRFMFSVLLVQELSDHYSLNNPWMADVMAVPLSMCDNTQNCAVINWNSNQETALSLSRAIAMSLGAPIDAEPYSNCTEDNTIMSSRLSMVDSKAEWSSCTNNAITNYLLSDKSACLQHVKKQSTNTSFEEVPRNMERSRPIWRSMTKMMLPKKHQNINDNEVQVYIKLHFVKKIEESKIHGPELNTLAHSILNKTQQLFRRHKLNLVIKLNLLDLSLSIEDNSMSHYALHNLCAEEARNKINKFIFSVLLIEEVNNKYSINNPWEAEVFANKRSLCNEMTNCAIIGWSSEYTTAVSLARALAISLGAPLDAEPYSNCTEDDTIMSPGPSMVDSAAEWSSCSNNAITNYLMSNQSACLQQSKKQLRKTTNVEVRESTTKNTTNLEQPKIHETQQNKDVTDKHEIEVNIKLHFIKKIKGLKKYGKELPILARSILDKVQQLLLLPNLNLAIKLNLFDLSISIQDNTIMSQHTLQKHCAQEAKQKKKELSFSVLLIEEVNNKYSINNPWEAEVFANKRSLCNNMTNCAIIGWSSEYSTAVSLARALAISLGAPLDAEPYSNCAEDTIMSPGPSLIDYTAEWSSCTKNGIMSYLKSDQSHCLRGGSDNEVEYNLNDLKKKHNNNNMSNNRDSNKLHMKGQMPNNDINYQNNNKKVTNTVSTRKRFNIKLNGQIVVNKHNRRSHRSK